MKVIRPAYPWRNCPIASSLSGSEGTVLPAAGYPVRRWPSGATCDRRRQANGPPRSATARGFQVQCGIRRGSFGERNQCQRAIFGADGFRIVIRLLVSIIARPSIWHRAGKGGNKLLRIPRKAVEANASWRGSTSAASCVCGLRTSPSIDPARIAKSNNFAVTLVSDVANLKISRNLCGAKNQFKIAGREPIRRSWLNPQS